MRLKKPPKNSGLRVRVTPVAMTLGCRLRRVRPEPVVEIGDLIPKWDMSGEPVAH
jgi:hypothetical protein